MNRLRIAATSLVMLGLGSTLALAQQYPRPDEQRQEEHRQEEHRAEQYRQDEHRRDEHRQFEQHEEWRRGYHMRSDDWRRGEQIDYRRYHLRQPPRGYEWREVDGRFILGVIATGVIADIIINAR